MLRKFGTGVVALCMAAGFSMVACSDDDSGAVCGNGVIEGSEVCDSTAVGNHTCSDEGFSGGVLSCNATCEGYDTSQCTNDTTCGDNVQEGTEACDGADLNNSTCQDHNFDGGVLACTGTCTFDTSGCTMDCTNDCPAEDDTRCVGEVLGVCTVGADGCLDWVDTDCTATSQICDDTGATAVCADDCTSTCTTIGATECIDATNLNTCQDGGDGCMYWTGTPCTGGYCDDSTPPAACVTSGSGETCTDAIMLPASGVYTGSFDTTGRVDDYGVDVGTDYTACGGSGGYGPDLVFAAVVAAGDVLDATVLNQTFTAALILSTDCAAIEGSCTSYEEDSSDDLHGSWANTTGSASTIYIIVDSGYSFSTQEGQFDLQVNVRTPACGDGVVENAEACDDGNTTAGDGCDASCAIETGFDCTGEPSFCYAAGTGDICGTGTGGPAIPLTPGSYGFDTTGFTNDYDDYNGLCGTNMTGAGPDAIFEVTVPDGAYAEVVNTDSVSFDGVVVFADDCSDIMGSCLDWNDMGEEVFYLNDTGAAKTVFFIIDGWTSTSEGLFEFTLNVTTQVCGNGTIETGEECDDGNTAPGDGCSDTCQIESGYTCTGEPSVCALICSNGTIDSGEDCDDGNTTAGDGCDANCQIETGFWCTGEPSICMIPACGDSYINDPAEECDDGNTTPGDGCDASCVFEAFACASGTHVTIASTDVPVTTVSQSTVTSTVTVPNTGTVTRVMVTLGDLTHTFDGDLEIFLISPAMTAVELTTDNGGSDDNYTGTIFDDGCHSATGLGPITGGSAPFTGCYGPEESLSTFISEAANGVWTLEVADDAAGDDGSLNAWTLDLCIQ